MIDAYNFIASWQLFPEKGTYELGMRPRSGIYRIQMGENSKQLRISMNWVSMEDQAFESSYIIEPNGEEQPFLDSPIGDSMKCSIIDSINFETHFFKKYSKMKFFKL